MRRIPALLAVLTLVVFGLSGCPGDTPPPPPNNSGNNSATASGNGPPKEPKKPMTPMVRLVPEADTKIMSPLIGEAASWPETKALKTYQETPKEVRSKGSADLEILKSMVKSLIKTAFVPKNIVDGSAFTLDGKVFLKLNQNKGINGLATRDPGRDKGVHALTFRWTFPDAKDQSLKVITRRLQSVSSPILAKELVSKACRRTAHPSINKPDRFQATFLLPRSGYGMTYPNCMLYGTRTDLIAIFQQVPHMKAPR